MLTITSRAVALLLLTTALIAGRSSQSFAQSSTASRGTQFDIRRATLAAIRQESGAGGMTLRDPSWDRLRVLRPLEKVEVIALDRRRIYGRLQTLDDDGIVVATSKGAVRVPRPDVRSVSVPSWAKRVTYGAIGAVAGLVAPVLFCPQCENEGHSTTGSQVTLAAGLGSLLFLIPQSSTMYVAKPKGGADRDR
jgi:hypothetical protein